MLWNGVSVGRDRLKVMVGFEPDKIFGGDSGSAHASADDRGTCDEYPPGVRMSKILEGDKIKRLCEASPCCAENAQSDTRTDSERCPCIGICLLKEPADVERFSRTW